MKEIPYNSSVALTKACTTYAASDTEKKDGRRFAAAAHLMVSEYKNVFEPVNWPNCIGGVKKFPIPYYPRPAYCDPGNLHKVGLKLQCPPNRFYCNTEERMMVWYTAKSYSPEITGQDFICGVILNLNTATVQNFTFYPTDGGLGFTPYWAVLKTNGEVPMSMMTEVEELTEEELTVTIPWEGRPVRIRASLKTGAMEYEEITSVDHRVWENDGFDKVLFATLDQTFEGQPAGQNDSASQGEYDCSQHYGDIVTCNADDAHIRERNGTWEYISHTNDLKKYSKYEVTIFDDVFTSISDKYFINDRESCHTWLQKCQYASGVCRSTSTVLDKSLYVEMNAEKKINDSVLASWMAPNIAFKMATKTRDYIDGTAGFGGYQFGGPDIEDFLDLCEWSSGEYYRDWITFFCFHDLAKMPISIWNAMGSENYHASSGFDYLTRESHDDTLDQTTVNEYIIDTDIVLDSEEVDKLYYLDDRATDDNHGVIVAGKGNSDEILFGEGYCKVYKPDSWDINWKIDWNDDDRSLQGLTGTGDYIDVREGLLEVLGCEFDELIDIGLV